MRLEIVTIPCRTDNYAYLLRDPDSGAVAVVDAPDAAAIEAALDGRGWTLDTILVTHHHEDHVAGVDRLRERFGARVVGAAADAHRLPALDQAVADGAAVTVGTRAARVIAVRRAGQQAGADRMGGLAQGRDVRTRLPSRGITGSAARIFVHRPTMFAGRIVKMA